MIGNASAAAIVKNTKDSHRLEAPDCTQSGCRHKLAMTGEDFNQIHDGIQTKRQSMNPNKVIIPRQCPLSTQY